MDLELDEELISFEEINIDVEPDLVIIESAVSPDGGNSAFAEVSLTGDVLTAELLVDAWDGGSLVSGHFEVLA